MNDIESAWYDYAKSVCGVNAKHLNECIAAGGASGTPSLRTNIRWPGYLGSRYCQSKLRLLCVGQVHHATELLRTLGKIQPLLERIGSGPTDPATMAKITNEYEHAIVEWGPWIKFSKIVSPLRLDETNIAYTNVAKCWQTLTDKPECKYPMRLCAKRFPIESLAASIQADAIVIMSADSTLSFAGIDEGRIPMYSFPGRPSNALLQEITEALHRRFLR
jgi:hypothetical protein